MDYDVIVIGGGAAGEAAAATTRELGGSTVLVERDLVGGICSFWACMPSKTLLDAAGRRALGAEYPWERASARRDWMISREGLPYPDDAHRVKALEDEGAAVVKGTAEIVGPRKVEVRSNGSTPRVLQGRSIVVAAGSVPVIPRMEGLEESGYWTSNDGTALRDLPSSILVIGGGAVGVELAQVYARFGIRTTLVQGSDRILPRDHPRSSEALTRQLRDEGVDVRTNVTGRSVRSGGPGRIVELSDGSTVEAAQVLVAVGRRSADMGELGLESCGVEVDEKGRVRPDDRLRVADGVYVAGDCAGGLQFTHVADYEGRVAARVAMGRDVRADLDAVPRTTFTDPETAAVGITVQEAWERGLDAFEATQDFGTTARGYTIEGSHGHITAVVDRERGTLVGAFAACPGASELIHEAVLAIKQDIPVSVLADAIHAFPTGARVFGNLMADVARQLS